MGLHKRFVIIDNFRDQNHSFTEKIKWPTRSPKVNEFATAKCNTSSVKNIMCTIFSSIYEKPAEVQGVHTFPKNK